MICILRFRLTLPSPKRLFHKEKRFYPKDRPFHAAVDQNLLSPTFWRNASDSTEPASFRTTSTIGRLSFDTSGHVATPSGTISGSLRRPTKRRRVTTSKGPVRLLTSSGPRAGGWRDRTIGSLWTPHSRRRSYNRTETDVMGVGQNGLCRIG
jgi:hypothetical protein